MSSVHIALLRGVNVGGSKPLEMAVLRAICEAAGGKDVTTYIQSGNVVFSHASKASDTLAEDLMARIKRATKLDVDVMVRSRAQLAAIVAKNPYPTAGGKELHVAFLAAKPDPKRIGELDAKRYAPEAFTVVGREIYLHLPIGMGRAKLPPALLARTPPATVRNWNTVEKLLSIAGQ